MANLHDSARDQARRLFALRTARGRAGSRQEADYFIWSVWLSISLCVLRDLRVNYSTAAKPAFDLIRHSA